MPRVVLDAEGELARAATANDSTATAANRGAGARIELPRDQLPALLDTQLRPALVTAFLELGFTAVSLDLEGLVSGKLNRALPQP